MYRFRSIDSLLGDRKELEKQQIYFADVSQLNDPLEGNGNYYWKGDRIVWINFFKHFILCLEHVFSLSMLMNDNDTITEKDIPVFMALEDLPTVIYKERITLIYDLFFSNKFVKDYMNFITNKTENIYIDEMYVHLKILSIPALEAIYKADAENGLVKLEYYNKVVEAFKSLYFNSNVSLSKLKGKEYRQSMANIRTMLKGFDNQLLFLFQNSNKMQNLFIDFTNMYLNAIKELVYPKCYLACFMDNCFNSSIWGTYGCNHTGVCLKFKTDDKNPTLSLKVAIGLDNSGNYIKEFRKFKLKPVKYSSDCKEIDFFSNLGSVQRWRLEKYWYTNDKGEFSVCSDEILSESETWRREYWRICEQLYCQKIPDWEPEREYRITLKSMLHMFDDAKNRVLEYKFEDLEAIIFGMKTSNKDKIEIMNIIRDKCKKNNINDFTFYQMEYSKDNQRLIPRKIYFKVE